ncbi:hypothetical protein [Embleya sp. AB8]|uniref:hypothetical protein n=1 Tax=Embleya sp. AB8 TaxID=3156304 RepID=UPI003C754D40
MGCVAGWAGDGIGDAVGDRDEFARPHGDRLRVGRAALVSGHAGDGRAGYVGGGAGEVDRFGDASAAGASAGRAEFDPGAGRVESADRGDAVLGDGGGDRDGDVGSEARRARAVEYVPAAQR